MANVPSVNGLHPQFLAELLKRFPVSKFTYRPRVYCAAFTCSASGTNPQGLSVEGLLFATSFGATALKTNGDGPTKGPLFTVKITQIPVFQGLPSLRMFSGTGAVFHLSFSSPVPLKIGDLGSATAELQWSIDNSDNGDAIEGDLWVQGIEIRAGAMLASVKGG